MRYGTIRLLVFVNNNTDLYGGLYCLLEVDLLSSRKGIFLDPSTI